MLSLKKKNSPQQKMPIITDLFILTHPSHKCLEFFLNTRFCVRCTAAVVLGYIFLGCKQPGCEADQPHHLVSWLRINGAKPPLLEMSSRHAQGQINLHFMFCTMTNKSTITINL